MRARGRPRIPTALFKAMLMQYGPPIEHQTEEVRSQLNRLMAVFGFGFNLPESTIEGHIITKGRVE